MYVANISSNKSLNIVYRFPSQISVAFFHWRKASSWDAKSWFTITNKYIISSDCFSKPPPIVISECSRFLNLVRSSAKFVTHAVPVMENRTCAARRPKTREPPSSPYLELFLTWMQDDSNERALHYLHCLHPGLSRKSIPLWNLGNIKCATGLNSFTALRNFYLLQAPKRSLKYTNINT